MIGFMAGAGIVVRNSIILVDFIELRLSHGRSLRPFLSRIGRGAFPADDAHGASPWSSAVS
jgi:Cu/Ag efflux pump CusA